MRDREVEELRTKVAAGTAGVSPAQKAALEAELAAAASARTDLERQLAESQAKVRPSQHHNPPPHSSPYDVP